MIAAHEYGHSKGLTHPQIFVLELAAADEIAKIKNDRSLKEDYLKWSSSNEMFSVMKKNLGLEEEQELWDDTTTIYKNEMKKHNAEGVFKKTGEKTFSQIN